MRTLLSLSFSLQKRPPFSPHNEPEENHWSFRDVTAMAQCTGTAPVFVDADAGGSVLVLEHTCAV